MHRIPGGQIIPADRVETVQVTLLNANRKVFSVRANKGMQNYTVEVAQTAGPRVATGTFQSPGELGALMRSASNVVDGTIAQKSSKSEIEGDVWLVTVTSGPVGIDVAVGPQPQSTALRNSLDQLTADLQAARGAGDGHPPALLMDSPLLDADFVSRIEHLRLRVRGIFEGFAAGRAALAEDGRGHGVRGLPRLLARRRPAPGGLEHLRPASTGSS